MILFKQAKEITGRDENFTMRQFIIEGYPVYVFNYRLLNYASFKTPMSKELRGLTFVEHSPNSYTKFLSIPKFLITEKQTKTNPNYYKIKKYCMYAKKWMEV